jgi:hypothetical protein
MTTKELREQRLEWVEKLELHGLNMTPWEEEFVESVGEQLRRGRGLSEAQAEILERIYAQRTS